jgi:hypothetical protein
VGVIIPRPGYFKSVREICTRHNVIDSRRDSVARQQRRVRMRLVEIFDAQRVAPRPPAGPQECVH